MAKLFVKALRSVLVSMLMLVALIGATTLAFYSSSKIASANFEPLTVTPALASTGSVATTSTPAESESTTVSAVNPYEYFTTDIASARASATGTIALQFFGDIMLDRKVAKVMGKRGLDYIFDNVTGTNRLWGAANITMANLEGPFALKRVPTSKTIAFRFDPQWAPQLKQYGFDAFSLANNHSADMGSKNIEFTRATLASSSIHYFGQEYQEGPSLTWYASTADGLAEPVAFIGFETVVHKIDKTKILKALTEAKEKARYIIVNVHGGTEYKRISNKAQRELYRWLIDNGASAVIGHHPHVVEEAEIYQGKPIFYSLGNFIFDQYFSKDTQEGLSVGLILGDGKVTAAYVFPFYSVKSQVFGMSGDRRQGFLDWLNKNSRLGENQFGSDGKLAL